MRVRVSLRVQEALISMSRSRSAIITSRLAADCEYRSPYIRICASIRILSAQCAINRQSSLFCRPFPFRLFTLCTHSSLLLQSAYRGREHICPDSEKVTASGFEEKEEEAN